MKSEKVFKRKLNIFPYLILEFGKDCYRDFPWRNELNNPYKIICTEILLQKTSAEKVKSIYSEFFRKFPNENILSNAEIDDIIKVIRTTGLYNKKSKCLIDTAHWIKKNGLTIKNISKLKTDVKGISSYVINAVLCFCFDKNVPLIDVNVKRVINSFFNSVKGIENLLLKCTSKLSSEQVKKFYFGIIDIAKHIRSKGSNILDEPLIIITINKRSYKNLEKNMCYWRFKDFEFKKKVKFFAFYRTSPIKSITMLGKIKKIERNDSFTIYNMESLFEIEPPINLIKGEFPAVNYKYSTIGNLINANSYSNS
jgi:A/G-specific adenine glycosylase